MSALPPTNNSCLSLKATGCTCAKSEVVPHTSTTPSMLLNLKTPSPPSYSYPATISTTPAGAAADYAPLKADGIIRTYASYNKQPIAELSQQAYPNWSLNLCIPIPKDSYNPTLLSLAYVIKYGSTFDSGDATVQADLIISPKAAATSGVITDPHGTGFYRPTSGIYGPQIIDEERATCISSVLGIKSNAGSAQWSHYIDHQRLNPNIHFPGYPTSDGSSAGLYLNFQVCEYPTAQTNRCLAIEVAATWSEDVAGRKAAEAAAAEKARVAAEEKKAKEEAEKKAAEEHVKKLIQHVIDMKAKEIEAHVKAEADKRIHAEVTAKTKEAEHRLKEETEKRIHHEVAAKTKEAEHRIKEDVEKRIHSEVVARTKEAEHRLKEEAEKRIQAEVAARTKEAEGHLKEDADKRIQAEVAAKTKEAEERIKAEEDKRIDAEVHEAVDEIQKKMKADADIAAKAAQHKAPDGSHADHHMQDLIKQKVKEYKLQPCSAGYGYRRDEKNKLYRCDGGSHVITFAQLGISS